jgi:hypothetical protein
MLDFESKSNNRFRIERFFPTGKEFIALVVCDQENEMCMRRQCVLCEDLINGLWRESLENGVKVKYYQWTTLKEVKNSDEMKTSTKISANTESTEASDAKRGNEMKTKTVKLSTERSVSDAFAELKVQLKPFLLHTFVKRKQASHFDEVKAQVNGKKIVLQVDYSENFSCVEQNEIQSGYWSHKQCTLFTAFAWINPGVTKSIVLVSDNLDHGKVSVFCYMDTIFKALKADYPEIEEINVFSDGAGSQFKQCFLFSTLYLYEKNHSVQVVWNYFATSHGKGVVDGIGGSVKGYVYRRILSGSSTVKNGKEFAQVAAHLNQKVCVDYIPMEKFVANQPMLEKWWNSVETVANTHQIHCVMPLSCNRLLVSDLSSEPVFREVLIKRNTIEDASLETRAVAMQVSGKKNVHEEQPAKLRPVFDKIVNSFVRVKIPSKWRDGYYVAFVKEECSDGYAVRFLRRSIKSGENIFVYPEIPDECIID